MFFKTHKVFSVVAYEIENAFHHPSVLTSYFLSLPLFFILFILFIFCVTSQRNQEKRKKKLNLPLARCKFVISEKVLHGCRRLISHQDGSNLSEQSVTNNHGASLWSLAPVRSSRDGGRERAVFLSPRCSHHRGTRASRGYLKADVQCRADGNDRNGCKTPFNQHSDKFESTPGG